MTELKNDRFLRALLRQPVDVTPVWMMRQAGRYLPEYRKTRAQAGDFLSLMKNPELATEVTLQPLRRYELDAAILFSDILTIPDAMGLGLYFAEGEGPRFERPIRDAAAVKRLPVPDLQSELGYVFETVRGIRRELDGKVPLIGFSGSPWTLATYMVEGQGSKNFMHVKSMMMNESTLMHLLLEKITQCVIAYLNEQIAAGAQAIMIFDTWGGTLTPSAYKEFSLQYMTEIVRSLTAEAEGCQVPVILFTKGSGLWLEDIAASGCQGVGLDWTVDIGQARKRIGDKVALQGNLDPTFLLAQPENVRQQVELILESYGAGSGHVFNLGHGILQQTNPEYVGEFIDSVHQLSKKYHS